MWGEGLRPLHPPAEGEGLLEDLQLRCGLKRFLERSLGLKGGEGCGGDQTGAGRPGRLVASTRVGGIRGREERLSRRAAGQEEGMG